MTTLRDIKKRLRSLENIKKITDAMERVAAVRLRKAQGKALQSIPYLDKMSAMLRQLGSQDVSHPLFEERNVKKTALIVISSDKGLCGSYNANICQAADKFLKNYQHRDIDLILFGKKAFEHFSHHKWTIGRKVLNWSDTLTLHEVEHISSDLMKRYLSLQYDEVWLIYTHFVNIMKNEVVIERFLRLEKEQATDTPKIKPLYIFEPSVSSIYAKILPRYLALKLYSRLNVAAASEIASRLVAMQKASKNSSNLITDLTLTRNKIRQEGITKEIIEISASS